MNHRENSTSPQAADAEISPSLPACTVSSSESEQKTKYSLSILSLIFGIASLFTYPFAMTVTGSFYIMYFSFSCAIAFSVLALTISHLSRMKRRRNGMALCGMVCGIITFSFCMLTILFIIVIIFL